MTPAEILDDMAATFRERGKVYGDNYQRVGAVMSALFPHGVQLGNPDEFLRFSLLEICVMKLTRLAVTNITHVDSAHDLGVYAAMLQTVIEGGPCVETRHSASDEQNERISRVFGAVNKVPDANAQDH